MSIVRFDSPDAYLAAAAPLIAHDVGRSAGLRAWIEGRKQASVNERAFMAIWRSSEDVGVAYQRGEQPVVIGDSVEGACVAFADALAEKNPKLDAVIGERAACEAFSDRWRLRTGGTSRLRFHMRHHALRALIPPPAVSGSIRVANQDDRNWLIEMVDAFTVEARLPDGPDATPRLVDERLAEGRLRIWTDREDVAFAGITGAGPDAARIGPVYTLPAFRANGYGAAIVGEICVELTRAGRQVFLVTDVANVTSNALYLRLGFMPIADSYWFDLLATS